MDLLHPSVGYPGTEPTQNHTKLRLVQMKNNLLEKGVFYFSSALLLHILRVSSSLRSAERTFVVLLSSFNVSVV